MIVIGLLSYPLIISSSFDAHVIIRSFYYDFISTFFTIIAISDSSHATIPDCLIEVESIGLLMIFTFFMMISWMKSSYLLFCLVIICQIWVNPFVQAIYYIFPVIIDVLLLIFNNLSIMYALMPINSFMFKVIIAAFGLILFLIILYCSITLTSLLFIFIVKISCCLVIY